MTLARFNIQPNPKTLAQSAAVRVLFSAFNTAQPLEVNTQVSPEGNPSFLAANDLLGGDWLTSLALRYDDEDLEFVFDECVLSIDQTKNIVKTPMPGKDGTVKEYISKGDYIITASAGILNEMGDHTYPLDQLKTLADLLELDKTLDIQSDLLDVFDITGVVVEGFRLVQETHTNRQALQIDLISDEPFIIELSDV